MMLMASHAASSSRRELGKRRAFRLGGDTLCFELRQRPEHPQHQPRASLEAAYEMNRLSLILMHAVASGPVNDEKRSISTPLRNSSRCLLSLLINSTTTHAGSLHTPAIATIQQTSPHVHSATAVGTKG